MKSVKLLFLVFFSIVLLSCEDDVEILEIERGGFMTFAVNGQDWVATNFKLNTGPLVAVPIDSPNVGRSFRRYSLVGQGIEPSGRRFQLSWIFDLSDEDNFIGIYNRVYTFERGGLHNVTLNLETGVSTNLYTTYTPSPAPFVTELKIKRQSTSERLVLGSYEAVLRRDVDSTQVLNIEDGLFEDVNY